MDKTVSDIGQIAVTVSDVAKALAFYRDALGLAFLFSPAPTLAFLQERAPQLAARLPDHELWIGFVRDPDGNLVGLMEEKR